MRDLYLVASELAEPVDLDALREDFDDVAVEPLPDAWGFRFGGTIEVRFTAKADVPEAVAGALGEARGLYVVAFEPGGAQPVEVVLDALHCAGALLARVSGPLVDVTAARALGADEVLGLGELDFDVRDHVTVVHEAGRARTAGMAKFGAPDVAIAVEADGDRLAAEWFLYDLATETAFGQGPPADTEVRTPEGQAFVLRRDAGGLTVEAKQGQAALLAPQRERLAPEPADRTVALRGEAEALLPAFAARFRGREPGEHLVFLVRAAFETHPAAGPVTEHLWLEVIDWEDATLFGRLVDGSTHTTEWHRGAHVEVDETEIDALALEEEGRRLDAPDAAARLRD